MNRDRDPRRRVGAVGPIETAAEVDRTDLEPLSAGPDDDPDDDPDEGPVEGPRIGARWQRLSRPARRRTALVAAVAVLALLGVLVSVHRPHRTTRTPSALAWPAQITTVHYAGIDPGQRPDDPSDFTIRLLVSNTSAQPVTLHRIAQPYLGMAVNVVGPLPLDISPGNPQIVRVQAIVRDCSRTPKGDSLAFLDVTLSNSRAMQTQSEILGDSYSRDLSNAILKACPAAPATPTRVPVAAFPTAS